MIIFTLFTIIQSQIAHLSLNGDGIKQQLLLMIDENQLDCQTIQLLISEDLDSRFSIWQQKNKSYWNPICNVQNNLYKMIYRNQNNQKRDSIIMTVMSSLNIQSYGHNQELTF
ncbi:unnamed protein product (macronuclear) [Paramecium tetraurelia]|uniref:Uncharacterized protein n=1 Tax=Paramecium tetraurelia TaxID=5888 RepID=A0C1B4_PARTE|nr:uncharacterized protein GSPATT00034057001 [Paramecium tetraurelia]CAK64581.1 unnamed protein product [Paramecium tetraurelia]|eukprot:XP_001431979.1 hypothetical protein (macronuclear) [Paramecium tetraurelia strain d4-2]